MDRIFYKRIFKKVWCLVSGAWCLTVILLPVIQFGYTAETGAFQYGSKDKRDPFIPLIGEGVEFLTSQKVRSIKGMNLEGVIFDPPAGSLAIINGEIIKEGENIGGFTLSKIKKSSVIFTRDQEDYTVSLITEEIDNE